MTAPTNSPSFWTTAAQWAGIFASLGFNVINYRRTSRVRAATVRYEEFKRIRTPVDLALTNLDERRKTLRSLEISGSALARIQSDVATLNKEIMQDYNSLTSALEVIDRSEFADGNNWVSETQFAWESFTAELNGAYNPTYQEERVKRHISDAADALAEMLASIGKRLDAQVKNYADF